MSNNIGDGNISVFLDGDEHFLTPNLKACIALSNVKGGISQLVQRCLDLEFDAIKLVITNGLGKNSKDLPEIIYRSGLINLQTACIQYLHIIANGGKPLTGDDSGDKEEKK